MERILELTECSGGYASPASEISSPAEHGKYTKEPFFPENIYLRPSFVDGRKGLNGLLAEIQNYMEGNPTSGDLFVFCAKSRRRLKMLFYKDNSYYLTQAVSMGSRYPWPVTEQEAKAISRSQFLMLIDRIDCFRGSSFIKLK